MTIERIKTAYYRLPLESVSDVGQGIVNDVNGHVRPSEAPDTRIRFNKRMG